MAKYLKLLVLSQYQPIEDKHQELAGGLSEGAWSDILTSICKKKFIAFVGAGAYTTQVEDGKTLIPLSEDIIEKWKGDKDLYALARIYKMENSYQLARISSGFGNKELG